MREPADVAKTNPLTEKPASSSEWAVTFTPVDVPTRPVDEAVSRFVAGVPAPQEPPATAADLAAFERSAQPLTCHTCGTLSDGADLFCIACGEFLEASEKTLATEEAVEEVAPAIPLCSDCGAEATEGEIFCLNCGAVLP